MKKTTNDHRLEYEAPTAEIIRLETEDILESSPVDNMYEIDDLDYFM